MDSDLDALLEKIKKDGIEEAERRAKEIEEKANIEAKRIIELAKKEAEELLFLAKKEIEDLKASFQNLLKQASRDILINLRNEINNMLKKLIEREIRYLLSGEDLAKVIAEVVRANTNINTPITVILKPEDLSKIKDFFFSLLYKDIKDKVILKSSDDIGAGFKISYDSNKSYFDFSDRALAEYLSSYLTPELNKILLSSINEK